MTRMIRMQKKRIWTILIDMIQIQQKFVLNGKNVYFPCKDVLKPFLRRLLYVMVVLKTHFVRLVFTIHYTKLCVSLL